MIAKNPSESTQAYDSILQNNSGISYTLTVKNGVPILVENRKSDHTLEEIDPSHSKSITDKFPQTCQKNKTLTNLDKKKNLSR